MCLAIPGRVIQIRQVGDVVMATLDVGGVTREVCAAYLPEVAVGDHVVASLGFAVRKLSEEEALASYEALALIRDLRELDLPGAGRPPDAGSPPGAGRPPDAGSPPGAGRSTAAGDAAP